MYIEKAPGFQPIYLVLETQEEVNLLVRIWNRSLTVSAVLEDQLPHAQDLRTAVTDPKVTLGTSLRRWDEQIRKLGILVTNASKA